MRTASIFCVIALVGLASSGCGNNNRKKAEKITDDMFAEMTRLATAFEQGDKSAVNSCITKLTSLAQQARGIKLSKADNDALIKRTETSMKGIESRMASAVNTARTSGKFTQAELLEIGTKLKDIGAAMKQAGS